MDVMSFCQEFFATGELMANGNRTPVCLIPKVKEKDDGFEANIIVQYSNENFIEGHG